MPDPAEMAEEPRSNHQGMTQWGRSQSATVPVWCPLVPGVWPTWGRWTGTNGLKDCHCPPALHTLLQRPNAPVSAAKLLVSTPENWACPACWDAATYSVGLASPAAGLPRGGGLSVLGSAHDLDLRVRTPHTSTVRVQNYILDVVT